MTAIPSRQRRRLLAAAMCGLGAACLLPVGVVFGAKSLLGSSGGQNVDSTGALKIPSTPAALLATINDVNDVTSLTAFVLNTTGVGGTIISLPVGTRADVIANQDPHRLGDTYAQAGMEALLLDAEGALDVTFSVAAAVSANDLTGVLSVLPAINVNFDQPVVTSSFVMPDPASTTTVKMKATETTLPPQPVPIDNEVFPAGEATLTPDQISSVLTSKRVGELELDRFARVKSVWTGIAAAVGEGLTPEQAQITETSVVGEIPSDIGAFMRRVFAGPIQVWQLSGQPLSGADNPAGLDLYALDKFEVLMILANVAPSSLSLPTGSLTVQIDSSFNDPNITHDVVERLNFIGLSVALIRELEGEVKQQTTIRYSDPAIVDIGKTGLESVLGKIKFIKKKQPVQGISAQIVIGKDFMDFITANPELPSTTVAPSE
ncbi:MAG: DUF2673 domain-containing protein [Actinomycetota bacterium]